MVGSAVMGAAVRVRSRAVAVRTAVREEFRVAMAVLGLVPEAEVEDCRTFHGTFARRRPQMTVAER
jgi:hypothetical protein